MKNIFFVILICIVGTGHIQGKFAVSGVNLITEQEIEIVCTTEPASAKEVYDNIIVTVGGDKVEYTYLSYFRFGPYANAPVINIRLKEPLNTGTLRGKTGNARTPGENTQEVLGPKAAAAIKVRVGNQTVTAKWAPFYDYMNIGSKSKLTATGTSLCGTLAENDELRGIAYSNEHVIDYAAGGLHRMAGRAELITQNAVDYGLKVMIVGAGQSVYEAPQWRELFNPADYKTRCIIEGTLEKPVIVTTADDVMRQKSIGEMQRPKLNYFFMGEAFARIFCGTFSNKSKSSSTGAVNG